MLANRNSLCAGAAALPWFSFWVVVLDALRPDYDFLHKAVSELGALGAPHMAWMNAFGFLGTGALLAVFAHGYRKGPGSNAAGSRLLCLAALLFMGTAVPMRMQAGPNPDPDYHAASTSIHLMFVLVAFGVWLAAQAVIALRGSRPLSIMAIVALALVVALFASAGFGAFSGMPGLVQRLNFAIFLGWYAAAALYLVRTPYAGGDDRRVRRCMTQSCD